VKDYTAAWQALIAKNQTNEKDMNIVVNTATGKRNAYVPDPKPVNTQDPDYLVKVAEAIATEAHRGQKRHFTNEEYISHPRHLASRFTNTNYKIVAWLHDTLEDNAQMNRATLEKYFSKEIVDAVVALTKTKGEDYFTYLQRVKNNAIAKQVKIEDLNHNMQGLDRTGHLYGKYRLAYYYLLGY
jgi:hypothetical protein